MPDGSLGTGCLNLERWDMRVPGGHFFHVDKDHVVEAGQTMEVGAPAGKLLRERGYELVGSDG